MGYTTTFEGHVTVEPPLNEAEADYLRRFAESRRMQREAGPYFADPGDDFGQGDRGGIIDYNRPPEGQPGLWCQWVPTDDRTGIEWDGGEKFYNADEWMVYLIDHFLKPGAVASTSGDPQFEAFTFDHVVNGAIDAQGEESDDVWRLLVTDNSVKVLQGRVEFVETPPSVPQMRVNPVHAHRARRALASGYASLHPDDREAEITDLLVDLLHLANAERFDVENLHARIWRHCIAEVGS